MRSLAFACALAATAASAYFAPASAEVMTFKADLSAASEVPAHPDLKGTGTVTAKYDTVSKTLTYTATYSGLTGPATMAHFHGPAEPGKNAGVMVPVAGSPASPIEGKATLTAEQAKALEGGLMYFNVHTEANKAGEIRGQVVRAGM